jgi:hypothetical protein
MNKNIDPFYEKHGPPSMHSGPSNLSDTSSDPQGSTKPAEKARKRKGQAGTATENPQPGKRGIIEEPQLKLLITSQVHYIRSRASAKVALGLGIVASTAGASRQMISLRNKSGLSPTYQSIQGAIETLAERSIDRTGNCCCRPSAHFVVRQLPDLDVKKIEQGLVGPGKKASRHCRRHLIYSQRKGGRCCCWTDQRMEAERQATSH